MACCPARLEDGSISRGQDSEIEAELCRFVKRGVLQCSSGLRAVGMSRPGKEMTTTYVSNHVSSWFFDLLVACAV